MPKTQTIIAADADDLAFRAAELFKTAARAHVDQRGRFVAALSGGSTPRGMHRLLASPPMLREVPWEHTHLFWVDERCVPASDPESNLGTAWRDLLRFLPLPRENIHFVRGDFPPEEAAAEYQLELTRFFQLKEGEFPIFDLIFLGMGKDGHTASLFPEAERSARREQTGGSRQRGHSQRWPDHHDLPGFESGATNRLPGGWNGKSKDG